MDSGLANFAMMLLWTEKHDKVSEKINLTLLLWRIEMKKVGTYFVVGLVIAFIGILVSDICGDFFNGMDYGSACVLGMGAYLCVVVIVCTGIIVSKLGEKSRSDDAGTKTE